MAITRADLMDDRIRRALDDSALAPLLLSDAELECSLQQVLACRERGGGERGSGEGGKDLWLFAYGSLIWNPLLHFNARHTALLRGYHRGFYLRSRINRGTPENPGLVLGLDRGGACNGVVYRIAEADTDVELRMLWRREMLMGSYAPRWVRVSSEGAGLGECVRALAFVVRRECDGYAGKLSERQIVDILLRTSGIYGTGADYLLRTVEGLALSGIRDRHLSRLRDQLIAARTSGRGP